MPVRAKCPHCSATFKVNQEVLGRKGKCKRCSRVFVIAAVQEGAVAQVLGQEEPQRDEGGWSPLQDPDVLSGLEQGEAQKTCPQCGESVKAEAKICRFCKTFFGKNEAPPPPQPLYTKPSFKSKYQSAADANQVYESQYQSEALAILMVVIPILTALLVWFWVGNMNLLQDPSSNLIMLMIAAVVLTAIIAAIEASLLGMGIDKTTGPVAWFLATLLFWIVAYPAYLYARRRFGVMNLIVPGILSALICVGSVGIMFFAVEDRKAEVRKIFTDASDRFSPANVLKDLGVSSPTPSTSEEPEFEIVEIDASLTDSNEYFAKVSWKLQLRDLTGRSSSCNAHIKFLDADEFLVHEDFEFSLQLGPNETKTFSFLTMMEPATWRKVESYKVQVGTH